MRFEFATAARIVFGPGTRHETGRLIADLLGGRAEARALVVTGRSREATESLTAPLNVRGFDCDTFAVDGEPTVDLVQQGAAFARERQCSVVIGFGGGSALDTAKAVAALATNSGDVLDYLEVIGRNLPLTNPPLPCVAIPTTAGTGAEVTRNAVLASRKHRVKVSLRSPLMLPRLAIVDPELTYDLPPAVTAATGLDALTQLIEPYVSVRANPLTDAICREGIPRAARSLWHAFQNGRDAAAREDMAVAGLFGGLALANAGLGAVHGFAGPIGGMFPAPHGAVCAALLPHVMAVNVRALRERAPASGILARYDQIAVMLTGCADAVADDASEWIRRLCDRLAIPPLRTYGITERDLPVLIEGSRAASSMKGNPVVLTTDELREVLVRSL